MNSPKLPKLMLFATALAMLLLAFVHPGARIPASAQSVQAPAISLELFTGGLSNPTSITHSGDGTERLFVTEKTGRVQIIQQGSLLPIPFLDIQGRVKSDGGEEGLLGLAFPPGFASNSHFYVYYTNLEGDNQVSRFQVSANPDQADPNSERLVIGIPHPTNTNHNGGQLAFGPDGYLYIGTGDGGGGGDPQENAQNIASLLGKILRIGVERQTANRVEPPNVQQGPNMVYLPVTLRSTPDEPYFIPADNPFLGNPNARPEIWAYGLRNPWRFSFDRASGDLYIADVGQEEYEEINLEPATSPGGVNYGWNTMEGPVCYDPPGSCDQTGLTLPSVYYLHTPPGGAPEENGCSVTGGYVYRGQASPALEGMYLFGDFCSGRIWTILKSPGGWQPDPLADTNLWISSFGEDEQGEVYVADFWNGDIYQVTSP